MSATRPPQPLDVNTSPVGTPVLGCIADDITGASDLADALVRAGLVTVQVFGAPQPGDRLPVDCDAVVIALKTRTCPVEEAVTHSLQAAHWLHGQGVGHIYFKYCSTFDSTAEGNIGPVADALSQECGSGEPVVHSPAYPVNQRTLYQGHLFVGSQLLAESGMRHHPLTPMLDANLVRVLAQQTPADVALLALPDIRGGSDSAYQRLRQLQATGARHVLADAVDDNDLKTTAHAVSDLPLTAGGAAFGAAWGAAITPMTTREQLPSFVAPEGYAAALVGSASTATAAQVTSFAATWPVHRLGLTALASADAGVSAALQWAYQRLPDGPVMIAADTSPAGIERTRRHFGPEHAADIVEGALAQIATGLVNLGVRRLAVGGGETSGAIARALDLAYVRIGPSICPGVPWTLSDDPPLAIAFKSGNFGSPDFFNQAFASFDSDHWEHA